MAAESVAIASGHRSRVVSEESGTACFRRIARTAGNSGPRVAGDAVATGLVLQDNAGDNYSASANGPFTFATSVASGSTYTVTASAQPSNLTQQCVVTNGSGTIGSANYTGVTVSTLSSGKLYIDVDTNPKRF